MGNRWKKGSPAGMQGVLGCLVILSLVSLFLSAPVFALPNGLAGSLYEATVPVSGQSESEREIAVQLALIDVLIKNTGQVQIASDPRIETMLEDAMRWVSRYVYRAPSSESQSSVPWLLAVSFDPGAIKSLIEEHALPFWSDLRPEVVVWLALEEGVERYLLDRNSARSAQLRSVFERQAALRGVHLVFPFNDEQDRQSLSLSDLWGGFRQPIEAASQRYQSNQMLVGRAVRESGDRWRVRWAFWSDYDMVSWEDTSADVRFSIEAAVDRLASTMSRHYATQPGNSVKNHYSLLFSGVVDATRYIQLQAFLSRQSNLSWQKLIAQTEREGLIEVVIEGQPDLFFSALANSGLVQERGADGEDLPDRFQGLLNPETELRHYEVVR